MSLRLTTGIGKCPFSDQAEEFSEQGGSSTAKVKDGAGSQVVHPGAAAEVRIINPAC